MAKKDTRGGDRHREGSTLVRLSWEYWGALKELAARNRRKGIEELRIAVEDHLAANGIEIAGPEEGESD